MAHDLYDHQLAAKEKLHNGSVLRGGVGSGKSRTAMAYYFDVVCGGRAPLHDDGHVKDDGRPPDGYGRFRTPRDLYVITTAKKRDDLEWEGEAALFGVSSQREVSFGGVTITVDSWNNIASYTDVENAFFIFDEQRLVGAGAWVKAFLKIAHKNQWILLTATPGDSWIEFAPIFIANGYYKNRTEFLDHHVVYDAFSRYPKIKRYIDTKRLERIRDGILVDMPFERHTIRHDIDIVVDHDKELFERVVKDRWNIYEERPIRDAGELFRLMRVVVNSHESRLTAVKRIFKSSPRLIVFYNFNFERDLLRGLASDLGTTVAEWNGSKHEKIPTSDTWIYIVQYTAGAEGWNCTTTNSVVFYSLNYSYKILEQAHGRIDRMNTPFSDLYYYILKSDSLIDKAIQRAINAKETFNERKSAEENFGYLAHEEGNG